jgi:hypothetical protein
MLLPALVWFWALRFWREKEHDQTLTEPHPKEAIDGSG